MLSLRLGHSRCDSLGGEPIPDWRQLLQNRAVPVKLRSYLAVEMAEAVRTGERTVKIVETPVLGVDHHNVFNLVDARRSLGRSVSSPDKICGVNACSQSQHRRE